MRTYISEDARRESLELYENQMRRIGKDFRDIYFSTSFGRTHIIETGKLEGKPLGHPGQNDETSLSHKNYDYGSWAGEAIKQ